MCENETHGILDVESCANIPELEGGKQCVKMSSMKRENDNMNLPRSKSVKRPDFHCQNNINILINLLSS